MLQSRDRVIAEIKRGKFSEKGKFRALEEDTPLKRDLRGASQGSGIKP